MTANVFLKALARPKPVIRLPLTALFQKGDKAAVWMWIRRPGRSPSRPVEVGRYTQDR